MNLNFHPTYIFPSHGPAPYPEMGFVGYQANLLPPPLPTHTPPPLPMHAPPLPIHAPPAGGEAAAPLNARQQYALNHGQVLASLLGRRFMWASVSMVIATVVTILLSTVAPWFYIKGQPETFYCKDNYLWIFIIPPLACIPLLFSSTHHVRLCLWHCWTVTVISIAVPAGVVFVSFGSSIVYTGTGEVLWNTGAFFVLLSYISCVLAGLLFMKLAHLIEIGLPRAADAGATQNAPPGPITVCIKADFDKFENFDDEDFRKSPTPGRSNA